jgi:hypothetical protein
MYCCTADWMYCCTAQAVLQTLYCRLLLMYRLLPLLRLQHRTAPAGLVLPEWQVLQQDSCQSLLHQVLAAPHGVARIQKQSVQGRCHCQTLQHQLLLLLQPQTLVFWCCCWHSSQLRLQWQQPQQLQRCWNLLLLGIAAAPHRFQTATADVNLAAAAACSLPAAACS